MKKDSPIRYTDEEVNEAAKEIWQGFHKEPQETPPISQEKEEKVVSYTADIKTYAIIILSIIILAILVGYNLRDSSVQDALDNIQYENKNKWTQDKIIDRAMISKAKSDSSIDKNNEVLKKYNIIYQQSI